MRHCTEGALQRMSKKKMLERWGHPNIKKQDVSEEEMLMGDVVHGDIARRRWMCGDLVIFDFNLFL